MNSRFYTVGHRKNYRHAIQENGQIFKMTGGYAFLTPDEAEQFLKESGHTGNWAIWEIECNLIDLTPSDNPNEWWHYLNREAPIIAEITN